MFNEHIRVILFIEFDIKCKRAPYSLTFYFLFLFFWSFVLRLTNKIIDLIDFLCSHVYMSKYSHIVHLKCSFFVRLAMYMYTHLAQMIVANVSSATVTVTTPRHKSIAIKTVFCFGFLRLQFIITIVCGWTHNIIDELKNIAPHTDMKVPLESVGNGFAK